MSRRLEGGNGTTAEEYIYRSHAVRFFFFFFFALSLSFSFSFPFTIIITTLHIQSSSHVLLLRSFTVLPRIISPQHVHRRLTLAEDSPLPPANSLSLPPHTPGSHEAHSDLHQPSLTSTRLPVSPAVTLPGKSTYSHVYLLIQTQSLGSLLLHFHPLFPLCRFHITHLDTSNGQ